MNSVVDKPHYEKTTNKEHVIYKGFGKRLLSILLSLLALPFVALSYIIVAPIIKLTDGGSVMYTSERLGRDGKIFNMYKYRSMRMNAPVIRGNDGLTTYKGKDDPRVTRIGRIIRKFGIDELPQILNVLNGDMSFIGPRPDLPDTIDRLTGVIPNPLEDITPDNFYEDYYKVRMSVRPGITGYSPIFIPRESNRVEKDKAEAWYASNMSLGLDLKILFATASFMLRGKHG